MIGDFERHLDRVPPASGPRIVAFLGGTIGNFPPGSRRRVLREIARLLGPRGPPADGHRPGQGPGGARGRLRRRAGRHGRVQPQRAARAQPRAAAPTSTPTTSSTSRCSTARTSGSRCGCAPVASTRRWCATSTCRCTSTPARSCGPRSAPSSRRRGCSRDLSAAGLELVRWLTDPEEMFALTLSSRTRPRPAD